MASGFFALFDDIALLMDDVAVASKVASQKTAAILGDDLAVSAEKASGFTSSRELPVIWAIAKGSMINKLIILPIAFLLSAFAPWAITPILMLGGIYLAYEGVEKIYEYFMPHEVNHEQNQPLVELTKEEILKNEEKKIKSAIVTDFILSIEIVIMALSTVTDQPLMVQIAVVSFVAFLATIGVYGFVALLVRIDDFGYAIIAKAKKNGSNFLKNIGKALVRSLPKIIKSLAVIGTVAMLLVAGGIYTHHTPWLHEMMHSVPSMLGDMLVGLIIGAIAFVIMEAYHKIKG